MFEKLMFWRTTKSSMIEHQGVLYPLPVLHILLAQSASAEVRRRFENQGNVFDLIQTNPEFQQSFLSSYVQANTAYLDLIKPHIPRHCHRILDIGCGIGLIDFLIYRESPEPKPQLFLLDKSVDVSKLASSNIAPTGFNQNYVFTASLNHTADFMKTNGVASADIRRCEVGEWALDKGAPFDFVFSRKSWGFHYPLSEYLDDVAKNLADDGVMITDVRSGQGGEELLHQRFNVVEVLQQGPKSSLILAQSPKAMP